MQAQLCNAVVRLKLELYKLPASTPSAVLLDNYNSLFWTTDLHAPEQLKSSRPPRRLDAQELTLGANLRALSDVNIGSSAVLVASCLSASVPRLPVIPIDPDGEQLVDYSDITLPLMDLHELTTMLQWYRCTPPLSHRHFRHPPSLYHAVMASCCQEIEKVALAGHREACL